MISHRETERSTRQVRGGVERLPLLFVPGDVDVFFSASYNHLVSSSSHGCRGLFNHECIVDWLRFELPHLLRQFISDRFYILPEVAMEREAGCLYPDMVVAFPDGHILFEVGLSQMGKHPDYATIHIGFDGSVSQVNPSKGSRHLPQVVDIIELLLPDILANPQQIPLM